MAVTTISPRDWPRVDYRPVATIALPAAEIGRRIGIAFLSEEEDGLGAVAIFGLRLVSGEFIRLTQHLDGPLPLRNQTEVDMKYPIERADALQALNELLREISATMADVTWMAPSIQHD